MQISFIYLVRLQEFPKLLQHVHQFWFRFLNFILVDRAEISHETDNKICPGNQAIVTRLIRRGPGEDED